MSKLNIDNLFPAHYRIESSGNNFDLDTLFKEPHEKKVIFNSKMLLDIKKEKQRKIERLYSNIYNQCCEKILKANENDQTDIIFIIPEIEPLYELYNTNNCIKFIQNKLYLQHINSTKISKTKIFVSWYNLEEKIKKNENENG